MRELATRVLAGGQASVAAFGQLLTEPGPARVWAAHHVLELTSPGPALRQLALVAIKERAGSSDATAFGERVWLQQCYDAHPEDRD